MVMVVDKRITVVLDVFIVRHTVGNNAKKLKKLKKQSVNNLKAYWHNMT